ncbi:MAG: T9SS type A sorting domain-containing protein [Bacteroidota bacterium]
MKAKKLFLKILFLNVIVVITATTAFSQCEPMGPDECPDPENNGEICPDTMPPGYLNLIYSEVATILVPEEDTNGILLHHIQLMAIDNLPQGLSWVSNAPNDEFMAGEYYCVLIEGTPGVTDTFYLKIVLDIYIDLMGEPVPAGQVIDSTSLSMIIHEDFGVNDMSGQFEISGNYPNPFTSSTNIYFTAKEYEEIDFEVFSLLGQKVHSGKINTMPGENMIHFSGENLNPGTYFYMIRSENISLSGLMVRTK